MPEDIIIDAEWEEIKDDPKDQEPLEEISSKVDITKIVAMTKQEVDIKTTEFAISTIKSSDLTILMDKYEHKLEYLQSAYDFTRDLEFKRELGLKIDRITTKYGLSTLQLKSRVSIPIEKPPQVIK